MLPVGAIPIRKVSLQSPAHTVKSAVFPNFVTAGWHGSQGRGLGRIGDMAKFSIRDVLFATVIVALALGWLMDRYRRETPVVVPATSLPEYELVATGAVHQTILLYDRHTGAAGAAWVRQSNGEWSPYTDAIRR